MTPEENKRRAADENVNYIKEHICDATKKEEFVFVSYKSDDWEVALHDVVYRLVKDENLNVYFDGSFETHNSLWIEQFPDNMKDKKCKGILVFVDDKYATSYATLMELAYSKSLMDDDCAFSKPLPVIPINLGKLTSITDEENTGLGRMVYKNGEVNIHAVAEQKLMDRVLKDLYSREFLNFQIYDEYEKRKYLSKKLCSKLVRMLLGGVAHDNEYERGGNLKAIIESIKNACGEKVFQKDDSPVPNEKAVTNDKLPEESINPQPQQSDDITVTGPSPLVIPKFDFGAGNPPDAIPDSVSGHMKKWTYRTKKGADAVILWDGESKNCKVLKGSIAAKESPNFAISASSAKKLKDQIVSEGKLSGLEFTADYDCDKISTMINLLNGGSVSMPAERKGNNLRLAEDDVNSANQVPAEAGTDNQELQFPEPAPLAAPAGSSSREYIYTYKNARIQCDINSNRCTVLKGSKTQGESPKFATNAAGAKKLKDELKQKGIIENDVFLEDYTGSMAKLLNLINGGSVSSTIEKKKFVREN